MRVLASLLVLVMASACSRGSDSSARSTPSPAAQATPTPATASSPAPGPALPSSAAVSQTPARPPGTENLVALEMGGRIENRLKLLTGEYYATKLLDGDPRSLWLAWGKAPHEIVLSFLGRDSALVSGVALTFPASAADPIWGEANSLMWPKDIEIWTSTESATAGFRKVVSAALPKEPGEHAVPFTTPVEARYVKIVIASNNGSGWSTMLADVAVREGQAPGYCTAAPTTHRSGVTAFDGFAAANK